MSDTEIYANSYENDRPEAATQAFITRFSALFKRQPVLYAVKAAQPQRTDTCDGLMREGIWEEKERREGFEASFGEGGYWSKPHSTASARPSQASMHESPGPN